MCVNTHYVYNRFVRKTMLVDCGKCPACLQKKANRRATRIRHNTKEGEIALFITLTYDNHYCPYILLDDLKDQVQELPVYRDYDIGHYRVKNKDNGQYEFALFSKPLGEIDRFFVKYDSSFDFDHFSTLRNYHDNAVGIIYYNDLQNFFKRLRINLLRHYGYKNSFSFFACAEYGPTTCRPHFHSLLFIPTEYETLFRDAIVESWPYADSRRTANYIEVARDAASYVSSYVNCSTFVPQFFKNNRQTKQKHSYSQGFGLALADFRLDKILEKADSGTMCYGKVVKREGVSGIVDLPIPEYVINRYFPKFKGYSRIAPDKVQQLLLHPSRLYELSKDLDYSVEDIHKIVVRLKHCKDYYKKVTLKSDFDYAIDFERVWRCRSSYVLRHSYDNLEPIDFGSYYDNLGEWFFGLVKNDTLPDCVLHNFIIDPNKLPRRLSETAYLTDLYYKKQKTKKVLNTAMHMQGHYV